MHHDPDQPFKMSIASLDGLAMQLVISDPAALSNTRLSAGGLEVI